MQVRLYGPETAVVLNAITAATGTNWTAFASQACRSITVFNTTGTPIRVRRTAQVSPATNYITLPDNTSKTFGAIRNANELAVQRADTSNTQVTVEAEAESV